MSVKAVARQSHSAIIPQGNTLVCADHNHNTIDTVTLSVILYPDAPRALSEYLYMLEMKEIPFYLCLFTVTPSIHLVSFPIATVY